MKIIKSEQKFMDESVRNILAGKIPHPLHYTNEEGFLGWLDISDPDVLLSYYRFGIFPWENFGHLGACFFPQKRYVIRPEKIKVSKSMRPYFNQKKFDWTMDQAFGEVMQQCKMVERAQGQSSWISDVFIDLYGKLFDLGYAHSVEVWEEGELVGGLYGVSTGKIFTGESMFSLRPNASKFALISLSGFLKDHEFSLIDCQIKNPHLATFGGFEMDAKDFFETMKKNYFCPSLRGNWNRLRTDE